MLFNSIQFAVFFAVVLGVYSVLDWRNQNRMLLVASYVFYGAWDWRFLSLILISTAIDFIAGKSIAASPHQETRKIWLGLSVSANLGILGFFKYFDFFSTSLSELMGHLGLHVDPVLLNVVLPVGISFYTFQTMSYTIDIYRGEMAPADRILDFALFVAFFPQLVAGPVERARHLLPQIMRPRETTFDGLYRGVQLILWGLFEKVFVADNLARYVDPIFGNPDGSGAAVIFATYAFAFQIFCDFDGYSNIARGIGRCLGFEIMTNFRIPYIATNPPEFWQRWHISLSSWLRDYLYIPLGGNRRGRLLTYRNLALTMLLGGLWHGASWTFVLWGLFHGAILIAHRMFSTPGRAPSRGFRRVALATCFFQVTCVGWLIFRASSVAQVEALLAAVVQNTHLGDFRQLLPQLAACAGILLPLIMFQTSQVLTGNLDGLFQAPWPVRALWYWLIVVLILVGGVRSGGTFIYFQF